MVFFNVLRYTSPIQWCTRSLFYKLGKFKSSIPSLFYFILLSFCSVCHIQPQTSFRLQNASWIIIHQNMKIRGAIILNLKTTKAYQTITNREYEQPLFNVKCSDLCHNSLIKVTKKQPISGNYCHINKTSLSKWPYFLQELLFSCRHEY